MSNEETNKDDSLNDPEEETQRAQEEAEHSEAEDSEWSINAYNSRNVLHMICSTSALPLCRAGRSAPAHLAKPVATGERLIELASLGKFSGEICRRCESKCSVQLVQNIRDAVAPKLQ